MYTYRNKNTGHVTTSATKWLRLEALPNWERTSGPAEEPVQAVEPVEVPEDVELDEALPRPSQNASKDAWVEYVCLAHDMDEARANAMTKVELIAYEPPDDE